MESLGKGDGGDPRSAPSSPGNPFNPDALLNKAVSNVITSLIYGFRFEYKDPRFLKLLDLIQDALKEESGFLHQVGE